MNISDPRILPYAGLLGNAALVAFSFYLGRKKKRKRSRHGVPLLWLNDRDCITLHQLYEGLLALGGTGSGKTSTLVHLMGALMRSGAGFLFLTAKATDFQEIFEVAKAEGRALDVIRFHPEGRYRFDFLSYELAATSVPATGQLIQDLVDFSTRTNAMQTNEVFWPMAAVRKIRMAMTVIYMAKGKCSIGDIYNFCVTMPNTPEQLQTDDFRQSFCAQCLYEAHQKFPGDQDLTLAGDYVLKEWPKLSDKTSGCIDAYVMNLLEKFVHGSVRELIASGTTNVSPDDVLNGKILVIDMPALVGREPYQFVQMVWKLAVQRAALRRNITPQSKDACMWIDEAQCHALPTVDSMVQAVSRSHKLINVNITQNIPLLESVLKRPEEVMAWVNNLQTWFTFANMDKQTNELCSARCGSSKHLFGSSSVSNAPYDLVADHMNLNQQQGNYSMNEQWFPDVPPQIWASQLRKGGVESGFIVDCIVTQGGRSFSNGKPFIKASFKQRV